MIPRPSRLAGWACALLLPLCLVIAPACSDPSESSNNNVNNDNANNDNSNHSDGGVDDTTPPVPGDSGAITVSNVGATSLSLGWTRATDNVTLQADLQYRVYSSSSDNIDTPANVQANGTPQGDWQSDLAALDLTGLAAGATDTFNVLVRDEAGNVAAYVMVTVDRTPPVPGDTGTLTTTNVGWTFFRLDWTRATDNVTPQADLQYRVYSSASDNLDTVADVEANGTAESGWLTDVPTLDITGLAADTTFYLNVLVRDVQGNVAAYASTSQATLEDTPPTVAVSNLRDLNVVHTGFLVGDATDNVGVTQVEVALDSGAWEAATVTPAGAPTVGWRFQLPTGSATWRGSTTHTIAVRGRDAAGNTATPVELTVTKGNNRDIDGDGYADLVIGAFGHNGGTGRIYVHRGSSAGLTSSATPILDGENAGDRFGAYSSALGDANGDGYADLAVGAYWYDNNRGKVYVFHGGSGGLSTTAARTTTGQYTDSYHGQRLAFGDINGDGYADLVIPEVRYNAYVGRVLIHHGGSAGIGQTADATLTGEAGGDSFGQVIALGDVNGDGYEDLVVGAYGYNSYAGRTYVFHGGGTGLSPTPARTLDGPVPRFGNRVALGDVDRDGYADLAVTADYYDNYTGQVYLYHGSSTGTAATSSLTLTGEATHDYFGACLALGDVDGDGYADLVVSASGYDSYTGRVYVHHGSSAGVASVASRILTGQATDEILANVALVDVDGDGFTDLVVAATGYSERTGRVYVHRGSSAGVEASDSLTLTGENTYNYFGGSFSH